MNLSIEEGAPPHLGRKIQRIREIVGLKQAALAELAGLQQQYISRLERRSKIPNHILEKLATSLGVTVEFIKDFDEENPFSHANALSGLAYTPAMYEQVELILHFFRRLLESERQKVATLDRVNKELNDLYIKLKKNATLKNGFSPKQSIVSGGTDSGKHTDQYDVSKVIMDIVDSYFFGKSKLGTDRADT